MNGSIYRYHEISSVFYVDDLEKIRGAQLAQLQGCCWVTLG